MSERFFDDPILNSPYERPGRHWELDKDGIPTQQIVERRRESRLITPIPKPKKRSGKGEHILQCSLEIEAQNISTSDQQYEVTQQVNSIRKLVDEWRKAPESRWKVTPETARLLKHWRHHEFQGIKPFFCQIEAAETAIWLTEVAPEIGKRGKDILDKLESANDEANAGLFRMALKLATGAGKTNVMAMLIAWQTINAARHPGSSRFTKGFLVVAPGLTIRDRLRVLQPNNTESYFKRMELVPQDLMGELGKARILITNYHAFRKRELLDLAKGTRQFMEGWRGDQMAATETEGQMLQRVMSKLKDMKQVLVINGEAQPCYQEMASTDTKAKISGAQIVDNRTIKTCSEKAGTIPRQTSSGSHNHQIPPTRQTPFVGPEHSHKTARIPSRSETDAAIYELMNSKPSQPGKTFDWRYLRESNYLIWQQSDLKTKLHDTTTQSQNKWQIGIFKIAMNPALAPKIQPTPAHARGRPF